MKAVIPVAGLGKRFRPWTLHNSKELMPVIDPKTGQVKATIDLVIEEANAAGFADILLITALGKAGIQEHLTKQQLNGNIRESRLHFTNQHEPKGLGDAIKYSESFVNGEDFAILLGDDFHDINPMAGLLAAYEKAKGEDFGAVLAVMRVSDEETKRYGIVAFEKSSLPEVSAITEKPASNPPSNFAVTGRYIVSKSVFEFLRRALPGAGGEIQLTDAISAMLKAGKKIYAIEIPGKRHDIGDPAGWFNAVSEIGGKIFRKNSV